MQFRKRKSTYFIADSFGCIIAAVLPIIFPYDYFHKKIGYEWYIILGIFYIVSMLMIAVSNSKTCYVIENDEIIIKGLYDEYIVSIKEIEYIKCVFSTGNKKEYELVLPDYSPNTICINVNLLNEEGRSLVTVLHDKYGVKLTNF